MKAYDCVQAARAKGRPTALSYIAAMIDGFVEMHGDRRFGDDPAVVAGIGYLNGTPITVVGLSLIHISKKRAWRWMTSTTSFCIRPTSASSTPRACVSSSRSRNSP